MRIGFKKGTGRTAVLLLHGLTGTPDEVRPLGEHLAKKGFAVLGPWLAGHGTKPEDLKKTSWYDWNASAIEALEQLRSRHRKVFVAGLSMGANLALHLAAHFPDKIAGVIAMAGVIRVLDWRFNAIGFFRFLQRKNMNLNGGVLDPEALPHRTYPWVPTDSLWQMKKFTVHLADDLPYVRVPALVMQGRKDSIVPPLNAALIHERLGSPIKHLIYLERSDHVLPLDYDRETVFARVERFIRTNGHLNRFHKNVEKSGLNDTERVPRFVVGTSRSAIRHSLFGV